MLSSTALITVASPSLASVGAHLEQIATERLARAEHMIETLRTCFMNRRRTFDEAAGERVVRFFRTAVQFPTTHESQSGCEDEWTFVVRFVGDHGQSLDWLMRGDAGGLIAAAIPLQSITEADSELIKLGAQFDELRDAVVAAESEYHCITAPRDKQLRKLLSDGIDWEDARRQVGDEDAIPGLQEVDERINRLDRIIDPFLQSLLGIRPATFAGIAVKLRVLRWINAIDPEAADANQDLDERWFNVIDSDVRCLAGELPSPKEVPTGIDPIFVAIGAQKNASWKLKEFYENKDPLPGDDIELEMLRMETSATEAFFRTRPSTSAGREAMIRRAIEIIQSECDQNRDDRVSFVTCGELVALLENLSLRDHAVA